MDFRCSYQKKGIKQSENSISKDSTDESPERKTNKNCFPKLHQMSIKHFLKKPEKKLKQLSILNFISKCKVSKSNFIKDNEKNKKCNFIKRKFNFSIKLKDLE